MTLMGIVWKSLRDDEDSQRHMARERATTASSVLAPSHMLACTGLIPFVFLSRQWLHCLERPFLIRLFAKLLPAQSLLQTDKALMADDEMVDQFDIEHAPGGHKLLRDRKVLR
jgi:hypothetical protein